MCNTPSKPPSQPRSTCGTRTTEPWLEALVELVWRYFRLHTREGALRRFSALLGGAMLHGAPWGRRLKNACYTLLTWALRTMRRARFPLEYALRLRDVWEAYVRSQ